MDAEDGDALLQQGVYENFNDLFAESGDIPSQGDLEDECRRLLTLVETTFWMIAREQEAEERYRDMTSGFRIDDRDVLIEDGVVDAELYESRWLVCRDGSDDVIEMFDDWDEARGFVREQARR